MPIPHLQNLVTFYLPEKPKGHQHISERNAYQGEYFKLCSLCLLHWCIVELNKNFISDLPSTLHLSNDGYMNEWNLSPKCALSNAKNQHIKESIHGNWKVIQVLPCLISYSSAISNIFKRFYLFIHERHRKKERGKDTGRGRSRLHAGRLTWDSILGLQDHALGRRQVLTTEQSRLPENKDLLLIKLRFFTILLLCVYMFKIIYCDMN